jgi:MoaA/NifB/PqqE/SkfB family radical SAM enzyme
MLENSIIPEKKQMYSLKLKQYYCDDIIKDENDLSVSYHARHENIRIEENKKYIAGSAGFDKSVWNPQNVLLFLTNKCSIKCKHCISFSSPESNMSLSYNILNKVFKSPVGTNIKECSVSGGEAFLHKNLFEIIEHFPVQSIVTNAFWAHSEELCKAKIIKFKQSLNLNKYRRMEDFYFCISADRYHFDTDGTNPVVIANAIKYIHLLMPEVKIILYQVKSNINDDSIKEIISILKREMIFCKKLDHVKEFKPGIRYHYTIESYLNSSQSLFVDIFPVAMVSRALLYIDYKIGLSINDVIHENINVNEYSESTVRLYQYTIGYNGSISVPEILFAPPIVNSVGNIYTNSWEEIIQNASRDPIIVYTKFYGLKKVIDISYRHFPNVTQKLLDNLSMRQQILYILLLNIERKEKLNKIMLEKCIEEGLLKRI